MAGASAFKRGGRGVRLKSMRDSSPSFFSVSRSAVAASTVLALVFALSACAPERDEVPMPVPEIVQSSDPSASPTPQNDPELVAGGTAEQNRAYFDFVNQALLSKKHNPVGKEIIDNLVSAGFDKSKMEVTPDKTEVFRINADAIEFSILFDDTCLIGEVSAQGYRSIIGPPVDTNKCLVGKTRPINW
ncbi:MAG: hypothetical protein KF772_00825 [Cryobacterium sp.]|nr:hypothetical protein [Cryobacterium sp.]MBX3117247.1 hypothetical protein [Cryobacterium sp.]MCC7128549.1 hypothetical protein [Microbacteriaceae bacterium]